MTTEILGDEINFLFLFQLRLQKKKNPLKSFFRLSHFEPLADRLSFQNARAFLIVMRA